MFSTSLVLLSIALQAYAGIYVTQPSSGSQCHAGQECVVDWLDDGEAPLLSAFGLSTVGLYIGDMRLVQTLPPVDVSQTHSFTFIPLAEAGANSGAYYIAFSSANLKNADPSSPKMGFSPFFSIDGMTGSFEAPFPPAITNIPLPSITGSSGPLPITTTIIVGTTASGAPSQAPVPVPAGDPATVTDGATTSSSTPAGADAMTTSLDPNELPFDLIPVTTFVGLPISISFPPTVTASSSSGLVRSLTSTNRAAPTAGTGAAAASKGDKNGAQRASPVALLASVSALVAFGIGWVVGLGL